MAPLKKYFFGSLFDFTQTAVDEIRQGFEDSFKANDLAGDVPLVSYDRLTFSFSFEWFLGDSRARDLFSTHFTDYIDEHKSQRDLLENARLIQLQGTVVEQPTSADFFSLDDDEGLLPSSDEEDNNGTKSVSGPIGREADLWKPSAGSVTVLSYDIIKALRERTGTTFFVNQHKNEVRLHGGRVPEALSSLNTLEQILLYLHEPANAHLLMLASVNTGTRIDFTIPTDASLRRIIVDPDVKSIGTWLGNKSIEQLNDFRWGAKPSEAFIVPENLTQITPYSSGPEPSNIWADFSFPRLGDLHNQAAPGIRADFGKLEKLDPLPISHFMSEKESHDIEQWAGNVMGSTDTSIIAPPTPNPEAQSARLRRPKDDEDEEDAESELSRSKNVAQPLQFQQEPRKRQYLISDLDSASSLRPVGETLPKSVPRPDPNTLNSQFNAQVENAARVRVAKDDSDDDESDDSTATAKSNKTASWTYVPSNPAPKPTPKATETRYPTRGFSSNQDSGRIRVPQSDSDTEDDEIRKMSVREAQKRAKGQTDRPRTDVTFRGTGRANGVHLLEDVTSRISSPSEPAEKSKGRISDSQGHDEQQANHPDTASTIDQDFLSHLQSMNIAKNSSGPLPSHSQAQKAQAVNRNTRAQDQVGAWSSFAQSHGWTKTTGERPIAQAQKRNKEKAVISQRGKESQGQPPRNTNSFQTLVDIDSVDETSQEKAEQTPRLASPAKPAKQRTQGHKSDPSNTSSLVKGTTKREDDLISILPSSQKSSTVGAPPPGYEATSSNRVQARGPGQTPIPLLDQMSQSNVATNSLLPQKPLVPVPGTSLNRVSPQKAPSDISKLSNREKKRRSQAAQKAAKAELKGPLIDISSETAQEVDEASTRVFHRTMNQQGKKPSERQKLKEETLKAAWGPNIDTTSRSKGSQVTAGSSSNARSDHSVSEMSVAKRKIMKAQESAMEQRMSEDHIRSQREGFVAALQPCFKAARAFPGSLRFEIELGQFLSPCLDEAYQSKCVTVHKWQKLYEWDQGRLANAATFTNILTRNGADVDHILKLKVPGGKRAPLFDNAPDSTSIRFEFHCGGKNNDKFAIVLDSHGGHEIERPYKTIGRVNIHIPGQVWDAAAILAGSTRFQEDKALEEAVQELVNSVYVPQDRTEIEISYRLPKQNEFEVKRITMKRISRHRCAAENKDDIQLQITEVQRLFMERRSNGVYLAYANKYEKMVERMMLHYEVSLVAEHIEKAMSANLGLRAGDLASTWNEEMVLEEQKTTRLLETVQLVAAKIDGIGYHNVGSAVFYLGHQESVINAATALGVGQRQNQPVTNPATQAPPGVEIDVPGVRGGIAQHVSGGYAIGYGGARIPIPGLVETDGLDPADSASQVPEPVRSKDIVVPGFW